MTLMTITLALALAIPPAATPAQKLYVANSAGTDLHVIDPATNRVINRVEVGPQPHGLVATCDGRQLFLTVENTAGETPLSDAPRPLALSKDETRLYANVDTLIGFEVADVAQRKVIRRVEADVPADLLRKASRSHGLGLRPDEKELWMCDVYHDRTYVFDLTADPPKQTATIPMKGGGYWLCFSPDGKRCYISERIGDAVAVIDTATKDLLARIPVCKAP